ncbi:YjiH family protein [Texcoconibacillus texcoconensis]|uniref:Nucleoside recognition membrane protein YjiH n=1 Tax=Texcoconibacillus texcoconensis TaxID=1095777 RepID=A0A840QS57_9BACI|nr:YjiH family protein [Texcoconibacillus texcoconensis]MBB5174153.1 nucleoside recognition membrane protein YjiH [Texcoconibacillus texcoconensis]
MDNSPSPQPEQNKQSTLKFILPSLIGVLLFMTPIPYGGELTIPIALLSDGLFEALETQLPAIMTIIILFATLGSIVAKTVKPKWITDSPFFTNLFDVTPFWFITRIVALVLAIMTLFQIGPVFVHDDYTGGLLLGDLLPILFSVFLFAGLFLPLLLNFGLLEFVGALLTKVMRPLFTLPGRSSIDSLTSWLGDGTIGVILTNKQYEEGFYSKREAAVIGTTFSVVSITFSLVVLGQVDLMHMFVPFYLTVLIAGAVAALIMPRIPPLSRKPQTYFNDQSGDDQEIIPAGHSPLTWGFKQAKKRASYNTSVGAFFRDGAKNILDMWLGVVPIVMAFGTIAVIFAEFTPLFTWLGAPFQPILQLLQIPEAAAASETMVVGFADMFLPAVLGASIESEMTRFVIACVSVTQLVYLSEVGGVLLGSKLPINLKDLIIIFLERTIITLPIIALIAHIIF